VHHVVARPPHLPGIQALHLHLYMIGQLVFDQGPILSNMFLRHITIPAAPVFSVASAFSVALIPRTTRYLYKFERTTFPAPQQVSVQPSLKMQRNLLSFTN